MKENGEKYQWTSYIITDNKRQQKSYLSCCRQISYKAHFIALPAEHEAEATAIVFYSEVYKHHGLPRKIISDRYVRFTESCWK